MPNDIALSAADLSPEIKADPRYEACRAPQNQGLGYTGYEHIVAAAALDEHPGQTTSAWDALVCASYWSGRNLPNLVKEELNAALLLAEKIGTAHVRSVLNRHALCIS